MVSITGLLTPFHFEIWTLCAGLQSYRSSPLRPVKNEKRQCIYALYYQGCFLNTVGMQVPFMRRSWNREDEVQ